MKKLESKRSDLIAKLNVSGEEDDRKPPIKSRLPPNENVNYCFLFMLRSGSKILSTLHTVCYISPMCIPVSKPFDEESHILVPDLCNL